MANNFRLGPEIEPAARSWRDATPADRLAFFDEAGRRVLARKRFEALRGIGADGKRLKRRQHPHPKLGSAAGAVLVPHRDEARTIRLMRAKATTTHTTIYWLAGLSRKQKLPWGQILRFHADGAGPLPKRDHFGLSPAGVESVRNEMARWWSNHLRAKAARARKAMEVAEREVAGPVTRREGFFARVRRFVRDTFRAIRGVPQLTRDQQAILDRYPELRPYVRPGRRGF